MNKETRAGTAITISVDEISTGGLVVRPVPDAITKREERNLDREFKEGQLADNDQLRDQRRVFANRIFWLMCSWLLALFVLLGFQGFGFQNFKLDENIVLALIGGTTANVLGIFIFVARYLFWKPGHSPSGSKENNST